MQTFTPRQLRQCLVEALELARMSDHVEAVARLERGLKDARTAGDARAISLLAKNAGLISMNSSALDRAASYFEEALNSEPSDAYVYLVLSDVYRRLGHEDRAKRALATCLEMAKISEDEDLFAIIQEKGGRGGDTGS
jgi:tetratricopeptide (TPR) repeat protein